MCVCTCLVYFCSRSHVLMFTRNGYKVGQLIEFEATGWSPPSYFGERQPRQSPSTTNSSSSNASELRQWYRTAARDWLQNNTTAVREMTRRGGDARLALVDAFYGGRNSHATIAGIAAEHARAGLRLVRAAGSSSAKGSRGAGGGGEEGGVKYIYFELFRASHGTAASSTTCICKSFPCAALLV